MGSQTGILNLRKNETNLIILWSIEQSNTKKSSVDRICIKNTFTNFARCSHCVVSNENISKWLYFFAAMQELKRNEYSYMKAGVVASRDQLCILESLKHV